MMFHSRKARLSALAGLTVLTVAAAALAQTGLRLVINSKTASTRVRVISGTPYVPVADVASALGMSVVKTSGGYEITPSGGANQLQGSRQGKIGDELLTDKWRFQVLSVETPDQYQEKYYQAGRTITPKGANDKLIVINCRLKNAMKKSQTPVLTERIPWNTALADTDGQSYPPIDYDARQDSDKTGSYAAASLLPGAKADFALVFSVPKNTQPKALVFTLGNYPNDVGRQGTDVRVALDKP